MRKRGRMEISPPSGRIEERPGSDVLSQIQIVYDPRVDLIELHEQILLL